ncbi:MAG: hypothetical protein Kow0029_20120 [Candidatus Rifleibacteriota bacterium]
MKLLARTAMVLLFAIFLAGNVSPVWSADDTFYLEFDLDSRNFADSTRKDWYLQTYQITATSPVFVPRQYDRNFVGTENDMFLALRGDLNETQFLDFKESLYLQHLNNEDYYARSVNSRKLKEIDHQFNLTYGIAAGDHDYFQLDFFNNYYDVPEFKQWQTRANKGSGLFCHEFSEKTCMSIEGAYEEREYENDADANFIEGRVEFEVLTFIRGQRKYIQLANSSRGNRSFFENFPNGLAAKKAVDFYTDWTISPDDDDPRAKYKAVKTRGDMYLRLSGEAYTLERTRINNRSNNVGIGLETAYELGEDVCLRLRDHYRKTDWRSESGVYFLYDHFMNTLSLAVTYDYNENISQTITFIDEYVKNINFALENYRTDTLKFEGFYAFGRSQASLSMAGIRKRFDENRTFYPDEDELKISAGYDYLITDGLKFRLRSEYVDKDYAKFEDLLWSSFKRNTWRAGVERILSKNHSLEIAYQENSERHKRFKENNLEEKSLNFSWLLRF